MLAVVNFNDMKVFDLLKENLIGKTVFTKSNIEFKVECVIQYYEPLENKVSKFIANHMRLNEAPFNLNGIKLVGVDKRGNQQELIATDLYLMELFFE